MVIINKNTVVVFSSDELKNILENENEYMYIFLGSNISLTSGIALSNKKSEIIIDGTYNGVMHQYTDQKKLGNKDGIYVTSSFTSKITVKNVNIIGYNYYGIIYVPELELYKNTIVEYFGVTYTGPQISYNPMGLTRFFDSVITIKDNYASGNEVAECNRIEIGGNTTIVHNSTANSAFWFRNSHPSLTILSGALVYFSSSSRELFYGVNDLLFTISNNASFYVSSYNGLAYGTYGTGTTLIGQNAVLSLTKTHYNGSYSTWYSYGKITLDNGSTLSIINNYENIKSSNYNIFFSGNDSGLIFNNPKKVILYNSVTNVISSNSSATFDFLYTRINLFDNSVSIIDDITKNTLPTYSWYKNMNLSSVTGNFTKSNTEILYNNYTEEELKYLPDFSNFNIVDKQILSIGVVPFYLNSITDKDTTLSGNTEAYASILIEYDNVSEVVKADENGIFIYSYVNTLPIGMSITFTVKSYEEVLYYTKKVEVIYSGELVIDSVTENLVFEPYIINEDPILCPRFSPLIIKVIDSRLNSSDWKLYAMINHELESVTGEVLKEALVFLDNDGNIFTLSTSPTLVYTGKKNEGKTNVTTISWEEDKGIILRLNTPLENNIEYNAEIIWTLKE